MPYLDYRRYQNEQSLAVTGRSTPRVSNEFIVSQLGEMYPGIMANRTARQQQEEQIMMARQQSRDMRRAQNVQFATQGVTTAYKAATHPLIYEKFTQPALEAMGRSATKSIGGAMYELNPVQAAMARNGAQFTAASTSGGMFGTGFGAMSALSGFGVGALAGEAGGLNSDQQVALGALGGLSRAALPLLLGSGPVGWGALALGATFGAIGSRSKKIGKWFKKVF